MFKASLFDTPSSEQHDEFIKEGKFVAKLHHENIIALLHLIDDNEGVVLIFPLMDHSLYSEIYSEDYKYTEQRTKQIMSMVLSGVKYLHEKQFVHRDLKPENLLVDCNGCVKISDFGLSIELRPGQFSTEILGTKRYIAPEVYLKFGYNEKVDIWVSNKFNL